MVMNAIFEPEVDTEHYGSGHQRKPISMPRLSPLIDEPSPTSDMEMTAMLKSPTGRTQYGHSSIRPSMRRSLGSRSSRSSQSGSSRGGDDMMMNSTSTDSAGGDNNDSEYAELAGHAAEKRIDELLRNSRLRIQQDIVALKWSDVAVEDMLGVGGFACVCLTRIQKLTEHLNQQESKTSLGSGSSSRRKLKSRDNNNMAGESASVENQSRRSLNRAEDVRNGYVDLTSPSIDDGSSERRFALKCLNRRTMANRRQFVSGAADLAGEAFLLSRLCHENIIRVYGATSGGIADAFLEPGGYFLVLEALEGTLHDLLNKWRDIDPPKPNTSVRSLFKSSAQTEDGAMIPSVQDRLQNIGVGIARGVHYLHQNKVLFRDIKPHNVGLDKEGNVRLFDFGLAREVDTIKRNVMTNESLENRPDREVHDKVGGVERKSKRGKSSNEKSNDLLLVKGVAGSLRYMAPETMLQSFCSPASDAYGFGILLWELCTLIKPFDKVTATPRDFRKAVAVNGLRPNVRVLGTNSNGHVHIKVIRALMESCWATDWQARPDFGIIVEVLEKLTGIESTGAPDNNKQSSVNRLDDKLTGEKQRQHQNEAPAAKSMFGLGGLRRNKRSSPNLVLKSHLSNESLSNWSLSIGSTANGAWNMSSSKGGSRRSNNKLSSFARGRKRSGNNLELSASSGNSEANGKANATWNTKTSTPKEGSINRLSSFVRGRKRSGNNLDVYASSGNDETNGKANATWNTNDAAPSEGRGKGTDFAQKRKSSDKLGSFSRIRKPSSFASLTGSLRQAAPEDKAGAEESNAMWNSSNSAKTGSGKGLSQKRRSANALASFTRSLKRSGANSSSSLSDNARSALSENQTLERQENAKWQSVNTTNSGNDGSMPTVTMVSMTGLHRLERRNLASSPALTSSYIPNVYSGSYFPSSGSQQARGTTWNHSTDEAGESGNANWNAKGDGTGGARFGEGSKTSNNRLAGILGMQRGSAAINKRPTAPMIDLKG